MLTLMHFSDKAKQSCRKTTSETAENYNECLHRNKKVKICEDGHDNCDVYDFVMWSADMKSGMRVWDTRKDEKELFSKTTNS